MPVDPIPVDGIQIETRGVFRSVHHEVPNLSFGSGGSGNSLQRLTCHTSARFRVRTPGPVSGQLYETSSGGWPSSSRFPAAFRPPAFASWASCPARELGPPCGRLTGPPESAPDPDGVSVFHTHEKRLGLGVLCTPETTVSTRSSDVLDRRLPHFSGMSLSPRYYHPPRGVTITRHQQGFTVIHPMPSLPFACDSQTERESLGFPLSFTPDRARPGRARQGRDGPWTLARITSSTSVKPPSTCSLITCDLTSQHRIVMRMRPPVTGQRERVHHRPGSGVQVKLIERADHRLAVRDRRCRIRAARGGLAGHRVHRPRIRPRRRWSGTPQQK